MRSTTRLFGAALLAALVAGCGGGGGADTPTIEPSGTGLRDSTAYSSARGAALASADESAAVTTHRVVVGGAAVDYTATAGHLAALAPGSGEPQASMFYVAYTVPSRAGPDRPIVYFFNGGPGSATVWLHLGSFAPRRIVTQAPSTSVPQPFQLVDNAESLIDVADLVFVDAVGSGYSQAVVPYTNGSFWSVDSDAALFRDFIARYAAVNGRQASPTYLFGESYGTTRAAVLAHRMVAASMRLDGVVLISSVLDYNANCSLFATATQTCEGFLPSYGMVGAWFQLTRPVPPDADVYAQQLREFASTTYGPAVRSWLQTPQPPPAALLNQLVDLTGAPFDAWASDLDLDAGTFRRRLVPGQLLGRYDGRILAPNGSALAAGGDPSSTLITAPFAAAAKSLFENELQYVATSGYTLLSNAIASWDFRHDGRSVPDAIPDLAAAIAQRPSLRTLSLSGHHDLATPFRQTELDLARLGAQPGLAIRVYPGGHMTYLDDGARARIRDDVAAFLTGAPLAAQASAGARARAAAGPSRPLPAAPSSAPPVRTPGDDSLDRTGLPQGGDPWLPPAQRPEGPQASPSGAALQALVARKIAERKADARR